MKKKLIALMLITLMLYVPFAYVLYTIPAPTPEITVRLEAQTGTDVNLEVVEKSMAASVALKTQSSTRAFGSGFHIGHGIIVTAKHCAKVNPDYVEFEDGTIGNVIEVKLVEEFDCAFLIVDGVAHKPSLEILYREAVRGERCYTLGNPLGMSFLVGPAHVRGFHKYDGDFVGDVECIVISSGALPGNSGGALVDKDGDVLGVVVCMLFINGIPVDGTGGCISSMDIIWALDVYGMMEYYYGC